MAVVEITAGMRQRTFRASRPRVMVSEQAGDPQPRPHLDRDADDEIQDLVEEGLPERGIGAEHLRVVVDADELHVGDPVPLEEAQDEGLHDGEQCRSPPPNRTTGAGGR